MKSSRETLFEFWEHSIFSGTMVTMFRTYHELHISSSGRLSSGGGKLLTEVGSRDDLLGESDSVVLEVNNTQLRANVTVVVDCSSHVVEQLDDQLRHHVSRRSLHTTRIMNDWMNDWINECRMNE